MASLIGSGHLEQRLVNVYNYLSSSFVPCKVRNSIPYRSVGIGPIEDPYARYSSVPQCIPYRQLIDMPVRYEIANFEGVWRLGDRLLSGNTIDWGSFCLEIHLYRLISTVAARYRVVSIEGEGRRGRRKGRTWRFGVALLRRSQSVATLPHRSSGVGDEMSPPRLRRRGIDRDHVILWAPRFDGADSFYMVPKLKGVSRDIHLILMKHLMEELR
ncbi:hypothetical protein BHE74_00015835 [Ensete ventricosum]|nr:hypothetical protein BHE74_00015835 [Ensete ventricosum]